MPDPAALKAAEDLCAEAAAAMEAYQATHPAAYSSKAATTLAREALAVMAKQSRYSIEIKDDTGKTVIFTADWTVGRKAARCRPDSAADGREARGQGRRAIERQASLRHERQHVTGPSVVNSHQAGKPLPQG